MTRQVLLVDDDASVREALGQTLELADLEPILAGSYIVAKDHVAREFEGVVVTDIRMPGKDGFALLDFVRSVDPDLPVILLTGEGDVPMAVRAISNGAFDFLEKPCAPKVFLSVVRRALTARDLVLENRRLKRELAAGDAAARLLRGTSAQSEELRRRVRLVGRAGAEVLVSGPPGSGTSKVAEVIHLVSSASQHPFVKRSAAALTPDGLAEAVAAAGAGTLFLDEVSALDPSAQLTLLDWLDSGGEARVIAGTYRDLQALVDAGRFSADLAMRLEVLRVDIPPLDERKEDIGPLFRHYVALACEQAALPEPDITPDVVARLMAQDWPGNARSLMNAAMRFAMGLTDPAPEQEMGLNDQLAQVERTLLVAALERAGGRAVQAAEMLKLPRKTFYDKLARHGLRAEDYRHD
ncbi:sigma-54-dependent transcriptional regulator [Tropicimonas sediminicola]|uniref:Two-component system, NtrC family, C4-dicarboxylate transport response regulator DctD n=1 Tax=Tropicimonas sediminicola TaxID=1031541 RepID=A0A239DCR5_9RHOB|nr:sigma-54 dependent transcriptional regulator [Tropicimonas sediminicola]SNS29852.1 two-component system, NtrC family, C4-dicarboxylate transport response regulator DctD [Tropicimonas sediminicola]